MGANATWWIRVNEVFELEVYGKTHRHFGIGNGDYIKAPNKSIAKLIIDKYEDELLTDLLSRVENK